MEMKFTPGPWIAKLDDPWDTEKMFTIEIMGTQDPDEYHWVASVHQQFKGSENGKANAKLIEAAPEMFDALEMMFRVAGHILQPADRNMVENLLTRITD